MENVLLANSASHNVVITWPLWKLAIKPGALPRDLGRVQVSDGTGDDEAKKHFFTLMIN